MVRMRYNVNQSGCRWSLDAPDDATALKEIRRSLRAKASEIAESELRTVWVEAVVTSEDGRVVDRMVVSASPPAAVAVCPDGSPHRFLGGRLGELVDAGQWGEEGYLIVQVCGRCAAEVIRRTVCECPDNASIVGLHDCWEVRPDEADLEAAAAAAPELARAWVEAGPAEALAAALARVSA